MQDEQGSTAKRAGACLAQRMHDLEAQIGRRRHGDIVKVPEHGDRSPC